MSSSSSSRAATLSLYRSLLRTVARFPSKKKSAIRADIIAEFRLGSRLSDSARISDAIGVARDGLATMQKYTGFDKRKMEWNVQLDSAPLGAGGDVAQRHVIGEFEAVKGGEVKKL